MIQYTPDAEYHAVIYDQDALIIKNLKDVLLRIAIFQHALLKL
ncbi:MAG TPA: hypothetical protein VF677_09720 [Flavobacterium sp.]|jgi:hypothetical protein